MELSYLFILGDVSDFFWKKKLNASGSSSFSLLKMMKNGHEGGVDVVGIPSRFEVFMGATFKTAGH